MKPFVYIEPDGLAAAVGFLREHGAQARVMAGGQSLLLGLKDRSVRPAYVVSLAKLPELKELRYSEQGQLEIGAAVTYARLASAVLNGWHTEVAAIAGNLADRCVRNMGTIGGAACQADPRFDIPTLLVGARAKVTIASAQGARVVRAEDFFGVEGPCLSPSELVIKFSFPSAFEFAAVAFEKFRYRSFDAALVSVLCACAVDSAGRITEFRIVVGAVNKAPKLIERPIRGLIGTSLAQISPAQLADGVSEEVIGDSSSAGRMAQYKSELIKTLVGRALGRIAVKTAAGA